jgi:putative PIN family toxin of toxin-antitoxin system
LAFRVFHLLRVALGTMSVRTGVESRDSAPVFASAPRRVVLDTNVLVSLYVFADSRFAPLRARLESGEWQAFSNAACFEEFARVLGYPLFALTPDRQQEAAAAYRASVTLSDGPALTDVALPRCKDRDDQKFLELARDAGADWLVTADKDLLRLARRDRLRGLFRILTPDVALSEG